ncbi:hypothetical protein DL96DRAFT_1587226 [Flagelloscypha sp. PMI_526]|nr:hypothetical protein DL96DRAFT_1587226 [Flagelloscypha sp. PMI_526]
MPVMMYSIRAPETITPYYPTTMALFDIPIRDPIHPPASLHASTFVEIFYPFVSETPMLAFPCFVSPINMAVSGVNLGMVLAACQIVANNKSGYLSQNSNGQEPISSDKLDSFLGEGSYYYFVDDDPLHEYSLCTTFDSWIPPETLPETWSKRMLIVYQLPLRSCLNSSHVIRQSLQYWFEQSKIGRLAKTPLAVALFVPNLYAISSVFLFESGPLCLTPIGGRTEQYAHSYHLCKTDLPSRIRRHYLYANFAYSVFSLVQEHFTAPSTQTSFSDESHEPQMLPDDIRPLKQKIITTKQELEDDLISRVGDTLDSDNVHLLTQFELEVGIFPGCAEIERMSQQWIRDHPQIRQIVDPTTKIAKIGDS